MKRRELLAAAPALSLLSSTVEAQSQTGPAGVPLIPVKTMFRRANYRNIALSPSGKFMAATVALNGRQNLVLVDLAGNQPTVLTRFALGDVNTVFWANDERLLYTTGDQQGLEFYGDGGLFAIDRDGRNQRVMVEPFMSDNAVKLVYRMTHVMRRIKDTPNEVLVSANDRSVDSQDVYRMNVQTGRKNLLTFESPGKVMRWAVDSALQPRAALSHDRPAKRWWSTIRGADGKAWTTIAQWDEQLRDVIVPLAFDPLDATLLYVASNVGRDTLALFKFDTAAMKLGEMLAGTEHYDLGSFWLINDRDDSPGVRLIFGGSDEAPAKLIGLRVELDRPTTVWFDQAAERVQRSVDAALPNAINTFDPARRRTLVYSRSPTETGAYYWFDQDKLQLEDSGVRMRPWIEPAQMAAMQPVSWTARDGMKIHGYLTLPRHYKKGAPVPLILHPHGGPWGRDGWRFNPEVQFMANRGYAVLQPNFRGSTGYGAKHLRASYKNFGTTMIDDMLDGVQWAIDQGYADKDRLATYGASYGGYAALMAMIRRPDWFKWGINYVGVTDLFVSQDTQPAQKYGDFGELAKAIIGDGKADRAAFEAQSPTLLVNRIAAPVFHAYGGMDRNVDIANGMAIKSAFDKASKAQEWMFVADEAHGYRQEKNVEEFYTRFERFMAAHTPPAR